MQKITQDLSDYTSVEVARLVPSLITVQSNRVSGLWVGGTAGSDPPQPVTSPSSGYFQVAWTPTGKLISQSSLGGHPDLWIIGPDKHYREQLTDDDAIEWNATASRDGRFIVYSSNRAGTYNIWRIDADGKNATQLTTGPGTDATPFPTPDGNWVFFTSWRFGKVAIWKVPMTGGTPVQVTLGNARYPVISPDGRTMACEYSDGQANSEWSTAVLSVESGKVLHRLNGIPTTNNQIVRWSPDGLSLTYVVTKNGVSNLWAQPISGGLPHQLTHFQEATIFYFDWSHDGKRLACLRGTSATDAVLIGSTH